jgi:phage terminase large subunit-like protein
MSAAVQRALPPASDGYWYDETAADDAVAFFSTFLHFTKDEWAGKPFRLEPWQEHDIIRPLFGWKRANGTRRYRRAIVFLPRKNGKTELAAGIALLLMLGTGVIGAEVYAIASTEAQARIVFDKAAAMVNMSPELRDLAQPMVPSIYSQRFDSRLVPLDGKATGKHGLNASGLVGDELHEWRNGDLYTTVHQSEAARKEPLEFLISTAGVRGKSFGWEMWQKALRILDGSDPDPQTLVVIYAADPDDDWTDEATWRKANPNLGVSVSLDYLREECREAQINPRRENDFRRYHLNQWTGQSVRWLQMRRWDLCQHSDWRDESDLIGRVCYAGVDLGSTDDLTAIAYLFPPDDPDGVWRRIYRVFMPEEMIPERVRMANIPYDAWRAEGALMATPGNCVDYEFVVETLLADDERFDIRMVGFDRHNMLHVTNRAAALGFDIDKVMKVSQGFESMNEPCKVYETLVLRGLLDHGGHPVARFCADNVMVRRDPRNNMRPDKERSADKIDVITADLIAQATYLRKDAEPAPSVYLTRGLAEIEA